MRSPLALGAAVLIAGISTGMSTPTRVHAAVLESDASGFTVRSKVTIAATPARVYEMLVGIGAWWDPQHTRSGDSRNMSIDARPGGCFCEALPDGGGVQHGVVVYAAPAKLLRLDAMLGPLQERAVIGVLTWKLDPAGDATTVTVTYAVGGHVASGSAGAPSGLAELAEPVDGVIGAQLERLAAFVETGKPLR
jgi:uncharacterized protein YndB with AHSA1/START domain